MTRTLTPEAKRALANAHRSAIRNGHIQCIPGVCRHGWPDIYHPPECFWQQAIEAIYKLEREPESGHTEVHHAVHSEQPSVE